MYTNLTLCRVDFTFYIFTFCKTMSFNQNPITRIQKLLKANQNTYENVEERHQPRPKRR